MDNFLANLQDARSKMSAGQYRAAFNLIIDQEVQSLSSLLKKIECMIDIGFILRDEKILRYGIYLLEKHGSEVLEVEDLAPVYFLNLANQYVNMITLSSYNDDFFAYYTRNELLKAREFYEKALSYKHLPDELSYQIRIGLARVLFISGRGVEALEQYQASLKIKPDQREALLEKIQLMIEYAPLNSLNHRELLKEAWHLCQHSESLKGNDIEDQQELELRGRIKELIPDRTFLDEDEEYPLHSIITNSEEEHQYTMFSLRHNLYLNLCGFCRKCDFAVGDQVRLSSSSFTIRQNQKNRFTSLSVCYNRLMELYRAGRFFLTESENQDRMRSYAEPGNLNIGLTGYRPGSMRYYLLRNAFLHGWALWDSVKDYLLTFWDCPDKDLSSLYQFFHNKKGVKEELSVSPSPSLHAIYDLYMDCIKGSRQHLSETVKSLKHPLQDGHSMSISEEELREQTIELYKIQRFVLLYLGIMHERNEFQNQKWIFPRPLYNFFMSEKE